MASKFLLFSLFIVSIIFSNVVYAENNIETSSIQKEYVIVLHGVARSSSSMEKIARIIAEKEPNFEVHNIDYDSTNYSFDELVDILHKDLSKIITNKEIKVNFVAYSMGALITRYYIQKYRPKNLGRVVMLAPPNQGSEAADFFKDNILFKKIFGKAGQRMGTKKDSIVYELDDVDFELGIIAGDRSVDPISSLVIQGADDGKVAIEKTKVNGMKEHLVLHTSHTFIIYNNNAIDQTIYFLKNGNFNSAGK